MPQREILSQHIFCFVVIAWVVSTAGANGRLHLLAGDNCYLSSMSLGTSFVICISIYFLQISLLLFCVREWEYSLSFVVSDENTFFTLPVLLPFNCQCIFIRCQDSLKARTRTCLFCNTMKFCRKSLLRVLGTLKVKSWWLLSFVKACDKCCVFSLCVFFYTGERLIATGVPFTFVCETQISSYEPAHLLMMDWFCLIFPNSAEKKHFKWWK